MRGRADSRLEGRQAAPSWGASSAFKRGWSERRGGEHSVCLPPAEPAPPAVPRLPRLPGEGVSRVGDCLPQLQLAPGVAVQVLAVPARAGGKGGGRSAAAAEQLGKNGTLHSSSAATERQGAVPGPPSDASSAHDCSVGVKVTHRTHTVQRG